MHATNTLAEANRQITICNACRYCESLCAVFPAMERRRVFPDESLDYLANLCHNCGACYDACQYVPPHDFAVNVPKVLAEVRSESYARYAWPRGLAPVFHRNGVVVALTAAVAVTLFLGGFVALGDPGVLFAAQTGPGAFYRLMPHEAMVLLFGGVFLFAILALAMSVRAFWRAIGGGLLTTADVLDAGRAAATLRYLDGGGAGCLTEDARPDTRRFFHHCTFYGFLLCFASTSLATVLHNGFGWQAPYPWYNPVVLLGIVGGIGLVVGPVGLLRAKEQRDSNLSDSRARGMERAFLVMLLLTSVTGLLLLVLRATALMGMLLAIHLGVVFALFLSFPYGKFVHGFYRSAALVRAAQEKRMPVLGSDNS
ncbi:MAG: tricarballylate utilization 4Fe-4S protein TcuB [Deltaproteobacteria bacterium]|nr:tricarballylate utilization 4Fe-4S protein TcuB [Deltaproteobacteria bacterium]